MSNALLTDETCPECGGIIKVLTLMSTRVVVCWACRENRKAAEARESAALTQKELRRRVELARVPARYQPYSLARVADYREQRSLPSVSTWPAHTTIIYTTAEYALMRRLRLWEPCCHSGWGLVEGLPGVGKSHMVGAWLMDLIRGGMRGGLWLSERELALLHNADFGSAAKAQGGELLARATTTHLLVWDDFGFTRNRDLGANVLGLRYERALPTVITTNFNTEQRTRLLDPPTASRIAELTSEQRGGWVIQLDGPDKRRLT